MCTGQENLKMKKSEKHTAEVTEFIEVCHTLAQNQYVTSSGGNLAWRLEDDLLLITPT
jgi:ribulose-5-phosphate 4-epimerase/fuculose-1-phosphate aldolase